MTLDLSPFLVKIYTPFDILLIHPASRQEIVLNIALCGDWAGNAWGSPGRGFRSGTEFEPGDPTKKKERKKWFERWFAERSFYVFVMGSEKLRSTWCLKKQGPALRSWASSEQRNLWVWGNVIKPYVKPLFPGFRLFYLYSLFILPLLVRSEGNWDFHCRYWRSAQGGTAARSAKTQAGKRSGWWLHGRKGLLPRRCLSRPGLKHIDNIDVRLQLLPGSLTLFLFFFSFFLYFFLLFSFFLSFVFLCFSLFQLCSSYVFIFFLVLSFLPFFLLCLLSFFQLRLLALPLLGSWPIKCWIRARCIVQPADTLLTFAGNDWNIMATTFAFAAGFHPLNYLRPRVTWTEPAHGAMGRRQLSEVDDEYDYPLVNKHSYWKWPFIVDFPIKNGDFQ